MITTYYWDMDGVLADFHGAYTERACAFSREWIANLAPFMHNVTLVQHMITEGLNVYILTEAANEAAKEGKIEWIKKYLPELNMDNFICIVGHGKKIEQMREPGMLIDDNKRNTTPWKKAGYPVTLIERGQEVVL